MPRIDQEHTLDPVENEISMLGSENIDEGPGNAETESFFSRQPPPNACPPKKQEPDKKAEQKSKSSKSCDCKPDKKSRRASRRARRKKMPSSVNPFIIFYLTMYFKNPTKKVTEVAREAGKKWCSMSEKEKADYIKKAKMESAKRQRKRGGKKSRGDC